MTKEELKGTKIWFGEDKVLRNKIFNKLTEIGIVTKYWRTGPDYNPDAFFYVIQQQDLLWTSGDQEEEYKKGKYKEITPSQLLGETEEKFKIGKCYKWYQKNHESHHYGKVLKVEGDFVTMSPWISNCTRYYGDGTFDIEKSIEITEIPISVISKFCPEEIPQEEVEFVECIDWSGPSYSNGKIYPVNKNGEIQDNHNSFDNIVTIHNRPNNRTQFKPSTREAYEAQQSKVNKCSTINKQENEYKNENKGCETKIPLDGNTGAKTGQSIRLRTTGVRIKCKSGLLRSGKEVTRTVKSSPRPKAEIGRRFTKGRS